MKHESGQQDTRRHSIGKHNRVTRLGAALLQDLRYGFRFLGRSPGFTVIAVIIMGLGIGANTAIFSILNSIIFRSLPYRNPSEIVRIYTQKQDSPSPEWISYPDFQDYHERTNLFSSVALASDGKLLSLLTDEGSEPAIGEFCSVEFFSMLEFSPTIGRTFVPEENEEGSEPVVIISHSLWKQKFGGDPNLLGQQIRINGHPVTVIGVGPQNFSGTLKIFTTDYWMPLGTAAIVSPTDLKSRRNLDFSMFARLNPGVSVEQAQAQLGTIAANLAQEYPDSNADRRAVVMRATDVVFDALVDPALPFVSAFLLTVVGLVLVVACSNLAGMLLMRASSRLKEVAIRMAVGATRWRLVRQLLTESALLGILGGAAGLLIALWIASAFATIDLQLPVILTLDMRLDWRVLLYTLVLSVATGILFGLAPALKASRRDLIGIIKDEAPTLGMERRRFTLRNFFVVTQVAVSLILLICGGLVMRAVGTGQQVDPGFNVENTAVAVIDVSLGGYREESAGRAFFDRFGQQLASLPGVETVGLASRIPHGLWGRNQMPFRLSGETVEEDKDLPLVDFALVTDKYFQAMDIPILQGRNFGIEDEGNSPRVVIVSESMASQFWGEANPIGRNVIIGRSDRQESAEVVGIARDAHQDLDSITGEFAPYLYLPFSQRYSENMVVIARTSGNSAGMPETMRRELKAIDPNIPVFEAKTMEEQIRFGFGFHRLTALFISAFGALTMILASIGLYGLVAFSVTQRTREVGIRIALGAPRRKVVGMVLKQGIGLVVAGLAIGLPVAVLLMKPLSGLLLGVPTTDPVTLGTVVLTLLAVAFFASYIPARRAAKLDPVTALRYE